MGNQHYIYAYLDPNSPIFIKKDLKFEHTPFYIGFGKNPNRKFYHLKESYKPENKRRDNNKLKYNKIIKILKTGIEPKIIVIKENLSEKEAKQLERKLVKKIGRKDLKTGPLTNLTDAGEGNLNPSKETRIKLGKGNKGRKKSKSEIQKIKDGIANSEIDRSGENHWIRKKGGHKQKTKDKISNSLKGNIPYNKGKTYEEIFGKDNAKKFKKSLGRDMSGNKNPAAKTFIFISPENKEFIVTGKFDDFCKALHFSPVYIRKKLRNKINTHKGWKIIKK